MTSEVMKLVAVDRPRSIGMIERLSELWCRHMHNAVMWPIGNHYQCRVCLRRHPVQWDRD